MRQPLLKALQERVLVLDGAMGTMLQERGLRPGQAPEEMNLDSPGVVEAVHREYAAAGADLIVTNTFGANRVKLAHYGLEQRLREINARAVEIARLAAGPQGWVVGSIGPTGRFVEPLGDASFDEMADIFRQQAQALVDAGADALSFETFLDLKEIRAGVIAAREVSADIPVIAMLTFDDKGRSVLGTPPEAAAVVLEAAGADVVGSNCGLGPDGITEVLETMRAVTSLPLISQANAGLPRLEGGITIFPASPEEMTAYHGRLLELGVRIIGGCCGTTPAHIAAIRAALEGRDQRWRSTGPDPAVTFLASRSRVVSLGSGRPVAVIGERINPTGKKAFAAELREGKLSYIRAEAMGQLERGAHLLDVNVGLPGIDEPAMMEQAVFCVTSAVQAPLVLDSSDPDALERGLRAVDGKALVNSVSGEEKSLRRVLPLVKKYGAAVVALTLDGSGIPETAAARLEVARRIVAEAERLGIPRRDVVVDCLTLTVSAEQERARETLAAIRAVKQELGCPTVLGVSNISFGLPRRPLVSSAFFAMAMEAGLDAAIINPREEAMMDAWRAAMVLLNRDPAATAYIAAYAGSQQAPAAAADGQPLDIRQRLARGVVDGDRDGIVHLVEEALAQGMAPLAVSTEGLLPGLEEVGRRFEKNIVFLPQVMQSAETMQRAFAYIKPLLAGADAVSRGRILMATVEGDIHDIGKNIVCTLLENHGYEVIDLGKNVAADRIVAEALERQVDAVGLSALMTTTMTEMERVIARLKERGVPSFTMVGGAVVTQEYADSIGADLYARDAMEAVAKVGRLLERRH
jgi:5-methyltetrahydrofolate--homocysteine methyltransferase